MSLKSQKSDQTENLKFTMQGGKRFSENKVAMGTDSNSAPRISIITVVKNGEKTIRQTIMSVIDQSWSNKEYIIIDGGSSDETHEIIRQFEDKIDYWISEPDNGIFHAMNKGIALATGEIIGILNADDWYEEGALETIARIYNENGRDVIIHGMMRNFSNEQFYSIKGNSVRVLKYDMIQHPACFIPKTIYNTYGEYDEKLFYSADYDLILRYLSHGIKFIFTENILVNFRLGGASSSNKAQEEMIRVMSKHNLISKSEAFMRYVQLNVAILSKKILKNSN
jgi:glycosyltransferase involved in cell wall biosynthesis